MELVPALVYLATTRIFWKPLEYRACCSTRVLSTRDIRLSMCHFVSVSRVWAVDVGRRFAQLISAHTFKAGDGRTCRCCFLHTLDSFAAAPGRGGARPQAGAAECRVRGDAVPARRHLVFSFTPRPPYFSGTPLATIRPVDDMSTPSQKMGQSGIHDSGQSLHLRHHARPGLETRPVFRARR